MRGFFRFAWVCALSLALIPAVGCSDTKRDGQVGNGGNGDQTCQSPLSDYCEEPDCPTWDQAVEEAEELGRPRCDGFLDIYSGPCGDLKYIFIGSLGGTIEYFDASGVLVAAERYDDVPGYCDETSFNIWYGPIPDCMRDSWNIWENFCKGSGYEYCALVSDCGSLDESECLSRYNNLQCWARWNNYVECIGEGGSCESCGAEYLPEWETCNVENATVEWRAPNVASE
jgi:hypothetical protein